jgi:hypothetical protein
MTDGELIRIILGIASVLVGGTLLAYIGFRRWGRRDRGRRR